MKFELNGKLHQISATQIISEKFSKREFVVECEAGMYKEYIKCDVINENIKMLDSVQVGWHVKAKCALKGRYFTRKDGTDGLINSITAYGVEVRQNGITVPEEIYPNLNNENAPF